MNFNVGQIVYILSRKETKVFPALVIEEICRKTVEKEITSYTMRLPNKEKSEVLIDDIDADIFVSLKAAESKMKESANEQISIILSAAKKMESVFQDSIKNIDALDSEKNSEVKIELGDGVVANLDTELMEL